MREPTYIIGAGGHARVIASLIEPGENRFVTSAPATPEEMALSLFLAEICRPDLRIFIGIGNNADRERIFDQIHKAGGKLASCIAPNAFIARDAILGEGVFVGAGALIGSRARIGNNCIVNTLSGIDHDCVLGDHTQVAGGVNFAGTVTTGRSCFFGMGSMAVPGVRLGDKVTALAGTVITRDFPDGVTVGGYPARVTRPSG